MEQSTTTQEVSTLETRTLAAMAAIRGVVLITSKAEQNAFYDVAIDAARRTVDDLSSMEYARAWGLKHVRERLNYEWAAAFKVHRKEIIRDQLLLCGLSMIVWTVLMYAYFNK